ncbi:MAG: zeta toxin family protein [bacterium]|nr:zeta toxin family protein [bacterium]
MTPEEQSVADEAIKYIKVHKNDLIARFADTTTYPKVPTPVTVFMAGSPGAGKTEFSKRFIGRFEKKFPVKIVRIDPDEIRTMIPGYTGANSFLVQGACAVGVEKLYDHTLEKKQNAIVDGTFVDYEKSADNIRRSLKRGREVQIYYIYQDPIIAWDFTQKREVVEGRNIPKAAFIRAFTLSRENVNKIKSEFGKQVQIHLVTKDYRNNDEDLELNIGAVDPYLKKRYSEDELNQLI